LEGLDFALQHVRDLGAVHQREFVNRICDIYAEENGAELSATELRGIFSGVKQLFAAEAAEEDSEASSEDEASESAESAEIESGTEYESVEETQSDDAESDDLSERDSYRPSEDDFDYAVDLDDSIAFEFASSASESVAESDVESVVESESVSVFESVATADISESESVQLSESANLSERESYDPSDDSFDYALDAENDLDSASNAQFESVAESESEAETIVLDDEAFVVRGISIFKLKNTEQDQSEDESEDESEASASELAEQSESAISETESAAESDGELAEEMASALEHVRNLAKQHQESLVNSFCDLHRESTGAEPSTTELLCIFGDIKQSFIENESESEEEQDILIESFTRNTAAKKIQRAWRQYAEADESADDDQSEASEYDPDSDSFDYCLDIEDDFALRTDTESESEAEVDEIDEAELIHSEQFAEEWHSAVEHIQQLASAQKEEMLVRAGLGSAETTVEMVADALSAFVVAPREAESDIAEEMDSALEHVRELGRAHGQQLADHLSDIYCQHNGEEPNVDELSEMFSDIVDAFAEEAADTDNEDGDFEEQFDSALEHVRELGAQHQPAFVQRICGIYAELSGEEATAQDLSEMFAGITESFADEEEQDFMVDAFTRRTAATKIQSAWSAYQSRKYAESTDDSESDGAESESKSDDDSATDAESESEYDESESGRESDVSKDSAYDPDRDTFDYCRDIEEDHIASSTNENTEDSESSSTDW